MNEKIMTRNDLLNYFEENKMAFINAIEELDNYSGYLGDDRFYPMDELDELVSNSSPLEIIELAFYGYDSTNSEREEFNPNRAYFRFNGYGNLESNDFLDYSDHLNNYFIDALIDDYCDLYLDNEIVEMIEEIEMFEEMDEDEIKEYFEELEEVEN